MTSTLLRMQLSSTIRGISQAAYGSVDKIDKLSLRKLAHQLADHCKSGAHLPRMHAWSSSVCNAALSPGLLQSLNHCAGVVTTA